MFARLLVAASLICLLGAGYLHASDAPRALPAGASNSLVTNEALIRGLYDARGRGDALSVFRHVFSLMGDEVNVYPTENYYYFECAIGGATVKGNIGLFADSRDEGVVSFTYAEDFAVEDPDHDPLEREVDLTARDGVTLSKVSEFKYTIRFEGKAVTFNLNDVGLAPPSKAGLAPDETFVGPSFDESGLQFHLIYSQKCRALFWVLNEDSYVPEKFLTVRPQLLLGRRTEFAFYDDRENHRRVLVGVKKENVDNNGWYDGPFDQLPDNYIKTGGVELRKYVEASYPHTKGKIDEYGIFLDRRDVRVAIAPYFEYSSGRQLSRLLNSLKASARSKTDFRCRLTRPK